MSVKIDDLRKLIPTATVIEVYICRACDKAHADRYDAQRCCEPDSEYACSVCNERFWRRSEADDHIREPHGLTPVLTAEEAYIDGLRWSKKNIVDLVADRMKAAGDED